MLTPEQIFAMVAESVKEDPQLLERVQARIAEADAQFEKQASAKKFDSETMNFAYTL